jgi:hypothetical protein
MFNAAIPLVGGARGDSPNLLHYELGFNMNDGMERAWSAGVPPTREGCHGRSKSGEIVFQQSEASPLISASGPGR